MSLKDRLAKLEAKERARADAARVPEVLDPVDFARGLGFEPDPWQAKLLTTEARQVVVCCSRQVGKSQTAALRGLHRAVYFPGSLVLCVAAAQRQSSELFLKVKQLVSKLGNVLAPVPELDEDNKLSLMFSNGSRVVSLPSNAATVRGFSAVNVLIEDEAAFVGDDFYTAVRPMLAVAKGQLILMSTPFGKRGHFFEAWENGGPRWERISIKATECPRISAEFLDDERKALGDWKFNQEYMCQFVEGTSSFFRAEDLAGVVSDEIEPLFPEGSTEPTTFEPVESAVSEDIEPLFDDDPEQPARRPGTFNRPAWTGFPR